MVGVDRFELPTTCSQSRRSPKLSYTPNSCFIAPIGTPSSAVAIDYRLHVSYVFAMHVQMMRWTQGHEIIRFIVSPIFIVVMHRNDLYFSAYYAPLFMVLKANFPVGQLPLYRSLPVVAP